MGKHANAVFKNWEIYDKYLVNNHGSSKFYQHKQKESFF